MVSLHEANKDVSRGLYFVQTSSGWNHLLLRHQRPNFHPVENKLVIEIISNFILVSPCGIYISPRKNRFEDR